MSASLPGAVGDEAGDGQKHDGQSTRLGDRQHQGFGADAFRRQEERVLGIEVTRCRLCPKQRMCSHRFVVNPTTSHLNSSGETYQVLSGLREDFRGILQSRGSKVVEEW